MLRCPAIPCVDTLSALSHSVSEQIILLMEGDDTMNAAQRVDDSCL